MPCSKNVLLLMSYSNLQDGSTALMYAAFGEDPRIIKALLQAGADIHHRNHVSWNTILCTEV
jgi:ankyrin repeat protein